MTIVQKAEKKKQTEARGFHHTQFNSLNRLITNSCQFEILCGIKNSLTS